MPIAQVIANADDLRLDGSLGKDSPLDPHWTDPEQPPPLGRSQAGTVTEEVLPLSIKQREWPETVLNGLTQALQIANAAADAFPPLKSITGGLSAVAEVVKRVSSNEEDIRVLKTYIEQVNKIISPDSLPPMEQWPATFKTRLFELDGSLKTVVNDLQRLDAEKPVARVLNVKDRADKIKRFTAQGVIAVEFAVNRVEVKVAEDMQHTDRNFNAVHQHIEGLRDHIDQRSSVSLHALRPVPEARFDYGLSGRSGCEQGTRREILATMCAWLRPEDPRLSTLPPPLFAVRANSRFFWMYAFAGAGKSTIAQTVAQWWDEDGILGASFFCARDGDRSNVLCIFRTIAYQLGCRFPAFRGALIETLQADPDIYATLPSRQLEKLVITPLQVSRTLEDFPPNVPIVIDALDECADPESVSVILKALSIRASELWPLRFFITSRPTENIVLEFRQQTLSVNTQELSLSRVSDELTKRDISNLLRTRFTDIRKRYDEAAGFVHGTNWPSTEDFEGVLRLSESLFIFAITALRFIEDPETCDPEGQLALLLACGMGATQRLLSDYETSPYWQLDVLYRHILRRGFPGKLSSMLRSRVQLILGTIVLAEERLSPTELDAFLCLTPGTVRRTLYKLQSIFDVPSLEEEPKPARFIHLSFADFIVDPDRCTDPDFLVDPRTQHTHIAMRCLHLMRSLKHNICEVDARYDHLLNTEIPGLQSKIARCLRHAFQYACKHWSHHLCRAELDIQLLDAFGEFCDAHLLHWLEALSLIGCVDMAVEALHSAQLLLKVLKVTAAFAPASSLLRMSQAADMRNVVEIRFGSETTWSSTLTSVSSGSGNIVASLDFSPDGTRVACGTIYGTIQLRSVQTGALLYVLGDHGDWVRRVAFSPTGRHILSGSDDGSVKLWDVTTGGCLNTWQLHSHWVRAVAWSSDGAVVASGSHDCAVVMWNIDATFPENATKLSGHGEPVNGVVFARDGTLLSVSDDKTCKIWDPVSSSLLLTLRHACAVNAVAVSSESSLAACALTTGEIVVWNKIDGCSLRSLSSSVPALSLTIYLNCLLAAVYSNSLVALWDIPSASPSEFVLVSDGSQARAAAFSPDGAHIAVANAATVHFSQWSTDNLAGAPLRTKGGDSHVSGIPLALSSAEESSVPGSLIPIVESTTDSTQSSLSEAEQVAAEFMRAEVYLASLSPDGSLVAAILRYESVLLDVLTGRCVRAIEHTSSYPSGPMAWSHTTDLVAWADNSTVCVWDTALGGCIRELTGHTGLIYSLTITPSDEHVISASEDGTIRRWNVGQHQVEDAPSEILFRCDGWVRSLALSSDSQWMLFACVDSKLPTAPAPGLLAKSSRQPSAYHAGYAALRLHDASSGRPLWIEHHNTWITSVAFSADCTRAAAGTDNGKVFLYDLAHLRPSSGRVFSDHLSPPSPPALLVPTVELDSGWVQRLDRIAFSPDSRGIVTERSYIPLDSAHRPACGRAAEPSLSPAYFYRDGWLWRSDAETVVRRVCWMPPTVRPDEGDSSPNTWSVQGHTIACRTQDNRLVVLDVSRC
ncbi:WD40 repeat-like protein [Trametes coccinea BRFM310]|uniref:WD40 repeat-like protein n=1 Tax=Trametes coccinea (strain BRFM310) TaxID=1353009 RepID=A0A1Y2IW57_TRAC3|nr:WD40 repeat-like protein [Trametes coccinea BRFM310]